MSYRLVALDVDGTTAAGGQMPSQAVREAVAAAQARGVLVVLATGRPYHSARSYAEALGLQTPLICFQGAYVADVTVPSGETAGPSAVTDVIPDGRGVFLTKGLPAGALQEVIRLADQRKLEFSVYTEHTMYTQSVRHPKPFYEEWFGLPVCLVPSLEEAVYELQARQVTLIKGLFIGEPDDNDRLIRELQDRYGSALGVIRSHPLFVEVVAPEATKGRAVAFLAERMGISQDETMAIGDSGNDLSMIEWAGLGIAVANATPDLLAVADWVAPSVAEDGVAAAIERFIVHHGPS